MTRLFHYWFRRPVRTPYRRRVRPLGRLDQLEDRTLPSFGAVGPEFRANAFTTGNQSASAVAADADGDFVVAWQSANQDGDAAGIYAQRFDAGGTQLGSEFRVNTTTTDGQDTPAVAIDAAGNFVVAWRSFSQAGSGNDVYAQRYSAAGAALGGEFRVNTYTTGSQINPAVAMSAGGGLVVAWQSLAQDGSGFGVYAQLYGADGAPVGGEFQVSTRTIDSQQTPTVAMDAAGNFVVAWENDGRDGSGLGIFARRYTADGAPQGDEFPVNSFRTGNQQSPTVALSATGSFVVAWQSDAQDGSGFGIHAQRYSADGSAQGGEFRVNTETANGQVAPAVASDVDGDFVVAWQSLNQDGNAWGIYAQRYRADGTTLGNEFRVNTFTAGSQTAPAVAADADGDFVTVWTSQSQDGSGDGVYGQRYTDLDDNGDTVEPTVTEVIANGGGGRLAPGRLVTVPVTGVIVSVSEALATAGPGRATDPANWRLERNGLDVSSTITAVGFSRNQAANRFEAVLSLTAPLTNGNYRLTARHTLTDVAGNRLDGRGDGSGLAADFEQSFTVAQPAAGPETQVNTYTLSSQSDAAVAVNAAGNSVVAWTSSGQDGSFTGVYAQRYNAAGTPVGGEFRVNSFTTGSQQDPAVAVDPAGNFVVTWNSSDQDGSFFGVYAQRYTAAGTPLGGEFRVNTTTAGSQGSPAVVMDPAGNFVVAWYGRGPNGSDDVFAQRYSAAGTPVGGEFLVNTTTTNSQRSPAVATGPDGGFVIAWHSLGQDGDGSGIYAQWYSAAGTPLGDEFRVNAFTTGDQQSASVAVGADGGFVVTWESEGQDADGYGVYARRYSAAGTPLGGEFRVNTFTTGDQRLPLVAADAAGNFVIAWQSNGQDGDLNGVYAKRYAADGTPVGGEFRVNATTAGSQLSPAVAAVPDGRFVVAWTGSNQDGSGSGVYATWYARTAVVEEVRALDHPVPIGPGAVLVAPVSRLEVAFSEALATTGPGSVTNLSNWQLFRNEEFLNNPFLAITSGLNAATGRYEAAIRLAGPLTDGRYRLIARPTILDAAGRALDGDFNGTPGGQFTRIIDVKPVAPAGPEFRVNTTTAGAQFGPAVAVVAAGNSVVVWHSTPQDGSGSGVYARRYSATGTPLGGEFRVNTVTDGDQLNPVIASAADGGFVVAWQSSGQDGSGSGVYAQRYNATGTRLGGEFRVNTFTTGSRSNPALTVDAAGNFVVAWESFGQDGGGFGVYAQRYNAAGTPLGGEFRVNTFTTGDQLFPAVAAAGDGGFVIAWMSLGQDGSGYGVYAQRYSAAGTSLGGEFRVAVTTDFNQSNPAVAADAAGNFVVAWQTDGHDGGGRGIYARRFDAGGSPLSGEFRAHPLTTAVLSDPAVAADADGDFVIAWQSEGQDGDGFGIFAQRYCAAGTPLGSEFRVNTTTAGGQLAPAVAVSATGNFVVAWESFGQDGSGYGVYAQRYLANLAPTTIGLPNITTPANSPPRVINLTFRFDDAEDGPEGLTHTVTANSNPALFSAVTIADAQLTLTYAPNATGTAVLTVRATDTVGAFVEATATVTVTAPPGTLQFSTASYSVAEGGGSATITVTRTGGTGGAVSVQYATPNGTATAGSDYTAASGTLTWADGDTAAKTFTVPILNDTAVEGSETVQLTLTTPTGGASLGTPAAATLTITDSPGTLQFGAASYAVAEGGGGSTITVTRTGGNGGAVSVQYATPNGTATAGSDYTAASGTLTWANGDTAPKTFTVPILNDTLVEGSEIVQLTLSAPSGGAALGTPATATLTITDDDAPPTAAPRVTSVVVNGGATQRSMVTQLTITFDRVVALPTNAAAAFRLTRLGPGAPTGDVTLAVDLSGSTVTQTNGT